MKPLHQILKVKEQTEDLLLLEVVPGSQIDLIANGFRGNERLFRLQKEGSSKYYTSFFGDELRAGNTYSWGGYGVTCASREFTDQRDKIVAVANDYFQFGI